MSRHIIQSLEFDITVPSENEGRKLMTPIEDVIKGKLVRTLEEVFDELDIEGEVIRAELLELDLGEINVYELDSEFDFRLRQKLKEILSGLVYQHKEEVKGQYEERRENDVNWLETFITTGVLPWWMNTSSITNRTIREEINKVFEERPKDIWKVIVSYYLDDHVQHRLSKYISQKQLSLAYGISLDTIKTQIQPLVELFPEMEAQKQRLWETVLFDRSGMSPNEKVVAQLYNVVSSRSQKTLTKPEWLLWIKIQPNVQVLDKEIYEVIDKEYRKATIRTFHFFQSPDKIEKLDAWVAQKSYSERSQTMREIFSVNNMASITRTEKLLSLMVKVMPMNISKTDRLSRNVWSQVMRALITKSGSQLQQEIKRVDKQVLAHVAKLTDVTQLALVEKVIAAQEDSGATTEQLKEDLTKLQDEIAEEQIKASVKASEQADAMVNMLNFLLFGLALPSDLREAIGDLIRYLVGIDKEVLKPKNVLKSRTEYLVLLQGFIKDLTNEELIFVTERVIKINLEDGEKEQLVNILLADHPTVMTLYSAITRETYELDDENQETQITQILQFYTNYGRAPFQRQEMDKTVVLYQLEQKYPEAISEVKTRLSPVAKIQLDELIAETVYTDKDEVGEGEGSISQDSSEKEGESETKEKKKESLLKDGDEYIANVEEARRLADEEDLEQRETLDDKIENQDLSLSDQDQKSASDQRLEDDFSEKPEKNKDIEVESAEKVNTGEIVEGLPVEKKDVDSGRTLPADDVKETDKGESKNISEGQQATKEEQTIEEQKTIDDQKTTEERKQPTEQKTVEPKELFEEARVSKKLEEQAQQALLSSVYIRNAGLILLAPYLTKLFERAGLLDKKKILVGQRNKIKAIEWLNYIVFGSDEMEEYDSLLSKIITDLPVSVSLPAKISLTQEEKDICDGLLKAVIANWKALKGGSIDNLRGSFLIRDGKLTKEDAQFTLIVEEKGYDLLIDRIPWSFRLINYKWMEKPVFIEWR